MLKKTIICVDDEVAVLDTLIEQLKRIVGKEYQVEGAESGQEALYLIDEICECGGQVPVVIADHIMPGMKGSELLVAVHEKYPDTLKIMLTGRADADAVGQVVNEGQLYRYIAKPWNEVDLELTVNEGLKSYYLQEKLEVQHQKLLEAFGELKAEVTKRKATEKDLKKANREIRDLQDKLIKENVYLREEIEQTHNFKEIIGRSDPLLYVLYRIEQVAEQDTTVLIQGETGTGKELVARAIHARSPRSDRPLIKINCAALPADLIESELFGYEKGAFTGALTSKPGKFELADKGTLFLDEIGELPIELQAKLLRAIEYGEVDRLGGKKTLQVDVRIIAATNVELDQKLKKKTFRKDLYYRLNVFPVTVPQLRKRPEDIPLLVEHFINRYNKKFKKKVKGITQKSMKNLQGYSWPGNIRELDNLIERAMILAKTNVLSIEVPKKASTVHSEFRTLETVEREYIKKVLRATGGKISGPGGAAEILGLNPNTLRSRMNKLAISLKKAVSQDFEDDELP